MERTIPGVDTSHDELLPFVGPAAALPFWSLLARLPFTSARIVWELLLGAAVVALALGSLALARGETSRRRTALALILTCVCGPVISGFTLGQAALAGAASTILALVALERRSAWALPAAFIAAIQPNLALSLATRVGDRRAFAWLAAAATAFLAVTLAAGDGLHGLIAYVSLLREHGAAERAIAIQHTVPALAAGFGVSPAIAGVLGGLTSLVALAAVVAAMLRLRAEPVAVACIGVALLPFIAPFFHEHDFAIDLLPAIVLLVRGNARVRAIAACATVMTMVDWFGLAQRPQASVQITALAFAIAAVCALLGHSVRAPFITAALLVAATLPLAHTFVAPTWPDALGDYHAPPGADISTIWFQEGVRSGLAAVVPAWSVLRAIPLIGCGLFAYASALLAAGYATKTSPLRTTSATLASDAPLHGPAVQ